MINPDVELEPMSQSGDRSPPGIDGARRVRIELVPGGPALMGELMVPSARCRGVVALPDVSRGSRHTAYNRSFQTGLRHAGFAVLLFDALTSIEKSEPQTPSNPDLLAERLVASARYLSRDPATAGLALGYLGMGAGSAGALCAAAELHDQVDAVVTVGGRPERAGAALAEVTAPVLLIAGATIEDLESACEARDRLRCENELAMVPGASAMCEGDPRPHRRAVRLAADWFRDHVAERTRSVSVAS